MVILNLDFAHVLRVQKTYGCFYALEYSLKSTQKEEDCPKLVHGLCIMEYKIAHYTIVVCIVRDGLIIFPGWNRYLYSMGQKKCP